MATKKYLQAIQTFQLEYEKVHLLFNIKLTEKPIIYPKALAIIGENLKKNINTNIADKPTIVLIIPTTAYRSDW
jgi:hypothetical protein